MMRLRYRDRIALIKEQLAELNPEALFVDGFDDALIGIARQFNRYLAAYSYKECVRVTKNSLAPHEADEDVEMAAVEYMEFNVTGAYVGENTPVFIIDPED